MSDDHPDLIATAVVAYYQTPAVWCGKEPSDMEWSQAPEKDFIKDVVNGTICNSINYRVRRDGLFVFDFTNYSQAAETLIPAYTLGKDRKIPKVVSDAEKVAEERAHLRTIYINVHQACINTA